MDILQRLRAIAKAATIYDSMHQRVANSFEGVMVAHRSDDECKANARLIAAAPTLHDVANELFELVSEERECFVETNRNLDTGEIPDGCRPYLERLDAALNRARAAFEKIEGGAI